VRSPTGTVGPAHPGPFGGMTTVAKLVYSAITSLDG